MMMRLSAFNAQGSTLLFFWVSCIFFLQSCATSPSPQLAAVAASDQKVSYDGTLTSRKKHFVALSPYSELDSAIPVIGLAKEKPKFMLTVRNLGESPISIGHDSVSVAVEDGGTNREISVQSLDDFLAEFEEEYNDGEKKYIYDTVYEIWNLVQNGGMSTERATDHMWDFKYNLEAMRRQKKVLLKMLPDIILTNQSIMPGDSYTGILVCDTRNLPPEAVGDFRVSVLLDLEEYDFTFHQSSSQ